MNWPADLREPVSPRRWLLAGGIILALAALTATALRWGMADAGLSQASREMARWEADSALPDLDSWLEVRSTLLAAQRYETGSPTVQEALARLHAQRHVGNAGAEVFLEQALEYFQRAAVQRPTSPYTWASIALTRYRLGLIDAELQRALANATLLGPWEPEVQFIVADIGFALWDELPDAQRKEVLETAVRGMKRYPDNMARIAEKRGRLQLACQSGAQFGASALKHPGCQPDAGLKSNQ
jgi:tetratricopeptide (TPR) repeat protein